MKNMKKITMIAAVFFALAFVTAFAGEALAARPDWIRATTPLKGHVIFKTGKDINKGDYLSVRIGVTYRNNKDSGRILTALFDKTLSFKTFGISDPKDGIKWYRADGYKNIQIRSTRVNKIEVWPNQTYILLYYVPVNKIVKPSGTWKALNQYLLSQKDCKGFFSSWTHDYQARSTKL